MRETETRIEVSNGSFEQNSVTIMTIHKSKGLEFPVVFLPAVHARGRYDSSSISFLPDFGLGIKIRDEDGVLVETSAFKKIKQYNYFFARRLPDISFHLPKQIDHCDPTDCAISKKEKNQPS